MKKLIIIIIILAVIFVGLAVYKNTAKNTVNNITVEEVDNIQKYISKIYMWKEITNEALPKFDDINNADELWIWEVVKKDLENYEVTYEEIQNKANEIFGENYRNQFPKEGTKRF